MPKDMMNTKEVAEYLGIHEKQVYALIKGKKIPCTRITGKWIFPKHIIDKWITTNAWEGIIQAKENSKRLQCTILSAGSNDPILDILLSYMKKIHPDFYIFSCNTGSTKGLSLLSQGNTDIAWCHLFDFKSGEYNIPFISTFLPEMKITVVHLFYRELGFVLSPYTSLQLKEFSDLANNKLHFINRQKGSGTRVFLDYKLQQANIDPMFIKGYDNEVYTHIEVGLSVLSGEADAGIATIAISKLFGLRFVPLVRESFDMILSQKTFFNKGVQAFIDVLDTENFRKMVKPLGNYDFKESGKIIYS